MGNRNPDSGYGVMNVGFLKELARLGVTDVAYDGINGKVDPVILWGAPPNHVRKWWKGQRSVIFTMWETNLIPITFRCQLDAFDTVIVPSPQNLEMFSEYHPDVRYVPLGVDTDLWRYKPRKLDKVFTFFTMGNSPRKGNDLLTTAFREVFGNGDGKVRLVVLDPRRQIRVREGIMPIHDHVDADELMALYENANCYLAPSRGEGFGFQPLQAICQGIPTILTNAHGQAQFAHLGIPIPAGLSQSRGFVHGDAGEWWEPDFDALCAGMRDVYDHYDDAVTQARFNAAHCAREWSWKLPGHILLDTLGDLSGEMIDQDGEIEPEQRRYLMRVRVDSKCNIAGINYQFKRGQDYYEVSDVKRVFYDAQLLDPSCIDLAEQGFNHLELAHAGP